MTPANLRNPTLNTLSRYHYRAMNVNDGGLGACTDDPAIRLLVAVTQYHHLRKFQFTSTAHKGEHDGNTHLRLTRTRVLLVTVAGPIGCSPSRTFRHVYENPGRQGPVMSSFQSVGGQTREKRVRRTNLPASTRFRIDLASSSCLSSEMRPSARGSLVCMITPSRASKCCMRCSIALM